MEQNSAGEEGTGLRFPREEGIGKSSRNETEVGRSQMPQARLRKLCHPSRSFCGFKQVLMSREHPGHVWRRDGGWEDCSRKSSERL